MPRPVCTGLVPPELVVGCEPRLMVWRNCVAKSACEALKPTVLEFARLLPTTLIVVSAADIPVSAVLMAEARLIEYPFPGKRNNGPDGGPVRLRSRSWSWSRLTWVTLLKGIDELPICTWNCLPCPAARFNCCRSKNRRNAASKVRGNFC